MSKRKRNKKKKDHVDTKEDLNTDKKVHSSEDPERATFENTGDVATGSRPTQKEIDENQSTPEK